MEDVTRKRMREIFETVRTHLLRQNQRSTLDNAATTCGYRGKEGLKCAAGVLIPDDLYDWRRAGTSYPSSSLGTHLMGTVPREDRGRIEHLLDRLQQVHDTKKPDRWPVELDAIGAELG